MTDDLLHIGTPRHSGRYPWGSGEDPQQSNRSLLGYVDELKKKGMTEKEIAEALGMSTGALRAKKAIAKTELRKEEIAQAVKLREKGMSTQAISERMGIPEATVRSRLNPLQQERADVIAATTQMLKDQVAKKELLDVGLGNESVLGISREKLNTAIEGLKEEGYKVHYIKQEQLGTGKTTKVMVLTGPDVQTKDIYQMKDKIRYIDEHSDDGGKTFYGIRPPTNVDSSRIQVKYGEDGGGDRDGLIELRRGAKDLDMGGANYAQVRIAVDGTHYLKGVAVYADDLPKGVDIRFNTPKENTGTKTDAMKPLKDDQDNPFGAVIKAGGQRGALNIVNEEGDWAEWSKTLSPQVLSKQPKALAEAQLNKVLVRKKEDFDEIARLTNPTIKKKLLESFADSCDSAAVHMKAAPMAGQKTMLLIPIPGLKPEEAYSPQFLNGQSLALVRFPHGGKFEIPEVKVNNKLPEAKRILKNAVDAIGIHPSVAARLSGADFDGDTVLAIPNDKGAIKMSPSLAGLKNFEPKERYKETPGMSVMSKKATQKHMGDISNLITDMTIKGATSSELARAVRHSMVVIDANKHRLDYKQSAADNQIKQLKVKYQGKARGGASTLISLAGSDARVPKRKDRVEIDPKTGKKIYFETGESYVDRTGKVVVKTQKSSKMAETDDARSLIKGVGHPIEHTYATHANKLKAMGNQARKELLATGNLVYSPAAAKTYPSEVNTLKKALRLAEMNAPRERRAQLAAGVIVKAKLADNPGMDADDLKRVRSQALKAARIRTGALKDRIQITDRQWEAIQAGAISNTMLGDILRHTDLDRVKELATPRANPVFSSSDKARARSLMANGATQAEVASALGVSVSTVSKALA